MIFVFLIWSLGFQAIFYTRMEACNRKWTLEMKKDQSPTARFSLFNMVFFWLQKPC